jgi:hypothetical protein
MTRIHPHVQRCVLAVREPTLGDVELGRTDSQVEEEPIDVGHVGLNEERVQVPKIALQELGAGAKFLLAEAECDCCCAKCCVILVNPHQGACGSYEVLKPFRVSCPA